MKKILLIEDDVDIAEVECDFLELEGFDVTLKTDGLEGYHEAQTGKYDLILLDLMLPNMNGHDICKQIRPHIDVPILMVTAKGEDVDKIRGLGFGADDYIHKPFSPTELVARVKANLAQYERLKSKNSMVSQEDELQIGTIKVNLKTRRVDVDNVEVELKNREYELLVFLMSNPNIIFSKEHLYEHIWGMDAFGDVKTVSVHLGRIRDKIEQDPQNPVYIQTVRRVGYRFKI